MLNGAPQTEENGNQKVNSQSNQVTLSGILANASTPSFHQLSELGTNGSTRRTHKCCVYIADNSKYCMRLNSIQAFSDINRDVSQLQLKPSLGLTSFLFFFFFLELNLVELIFCFKWVRS